MGVQRRHTDMKTIFTLLLLPLVCYAAAANPGGYNYGEYEQQQYQVDRYDTQPQQYQQDRYDTQPQQYQQDRYDTQPHQPEDRYDTVAYQPNSYATPYQPAQYKPAEPVHPAHYQEEEEKYPPKPFAYEYGGADESGRHFAKTETSDDDGVVRGEYRVELPDGRVQIVSYTADHVNGYQADVRYEGEARPYVPEEQGYEEPRQKYVPQHKPYARRY